MYVKDIMTKTITSCRTTDTLAAAARAMWEQDCGAIPVTSDDGRLAGVITDRDICIATYTKNVRPSELSITSAMAKQVYSCREQDDIEKALDMMRTKQIRRLPVIDRSGALIGMLSIADLSRTVVQHDAARKGLSCESVMQTIAEICAPRVPMSV